ncbi:hypothetical protein VOLCADRAFT_89153 [Volvox carteri f. nagariensis]|uniref:Uncharacterized protein n=1 Tax=Volvox carteri f. nagariensis TaxID=3068 RepID=D8TQX9_VOLCA|nr:uncharacterized protein VOLCADRAFT_89153 [Volvox carteri f. nagariensis]EFJ50237.1 hypothetical protein VOLCADRAFT_89153 [Volvox carteri f. nagariensis]|eukprot:XP_002948857.1 hypothetical protein VOLCADRAFT_89153 [Volvox carteri f. nagariensis]
MNHIHVSAVLTHLSQLASVDASVASALAAAAHPSATPALHPNHGALNPSELPNTSPDSRHPESSISSGRSRASSPRLEGIPAECHADAVTTGAVSGPAVDGMGEDPACVRELLRVLLTLFYEQLPSFEPRQLANTAWALGKWPAGLAGRDDALVAVLDASMPLLPHFGAQELSNLLHGWASCVSSSRAGAAAITTTTTGGGNGNRNGNDDGGNSTASVPAAAPAPLRNRSPTGPPPVPPVNKPLSPLGPQQERRGPSTPEFPVTQFEPQRFLEAHCRACAHQLRRGRFKMQELSNLLWSWGVLLGVGAGGAEAGPGGAGPKRSNSSSSNNNGGGGGGRSSSWIPGFLRSGEGVVGRGQPSDGPKAIAAAAAGGRDVAAVPYLELLTAQLQLGMSSAGPQELANSMLSLARLQVLPPLEWLEAFLQASRGHLLADLSQQAVPGSCNDGSNGASGSAVDSRSDFPPSRQRLMPPPSRLTHGSAAAARVGFSPQELSNLLWGCSKLHLRLPPAYLDDVAPALERCLPLMTLPERVNVLWALAWQAKLGVGDHWGPALWNAAAVAEEPAEAAAGAPGPYCTPGGGPDRERVHGTAGAAHDRGVAACGWEGSSAGSRTEAQVPEWVRRQGAGREIERGKAVLAALAAAEATAEDDGGGANDGELLQGVVAGAAGLGFGAGRPATARYGDVGERLDGRGAPTADVGSQCGSPEEEARGDVDDGDESLELEMDQRRRDVAAATGAGGSSSTAVVAAAAAASAATGAPVDQDEAIGLLLGPRTENSTMLRNPLRPPPPPPLPDLDAAQRQRAHPAGGHQPQAGEKTDSNPKRDVDVVNQPISHESNTQYHLLHQQQHHHHHRQQQQQQQRKGRELRTTLVNPPLDQPDVSVALWSVATLAASSFSASTASRTDACMSLLPTLATTSAAASPAAADGGFFPVGPDSPVGFNHRGHNQTHDYNRRGERIVSAVVDGDVDGRMGNLTDHAERNGEAAADGVASSAHDTVITFSVGGNGAVRVSALLEPQEADALVRLWSRWLEGMSPQGQANCIWAAVRLRLRLPHDLQSRLATWLHRRAADLGPAETAAALRGLGLLSAQLRPSAEMSRAAAALLEQAYVRAGRYGLCELAQVCYGGALLLRWVGRAGAAAAADLESVHGLTVGAGGDGLPAAPQQQQQMALLPAAAAVRMSMDLEDAGVFLPAVGTALLAADGSGGGGGFSPLAAAAAAAQQRRLAQPLDALLGRLQMAYRREDGRGAPPRPDAGTAPACHRRGGGELCTSRQGSSMDEFTRSGRLAERREELRQLRQQQQQQQQQQEQQQQQQDREQRQNPQSANWVASGLSTNWLQRFWATSAPSLEEVSPKEAAMLLWAMSSLAVQPPSPWISTLLRAVEPHLRAAAVRGGASGGGGVSDQTLGVLLSSLGHLRVRPSPEWMAAALAAVDVWATEGVDERGSEGRGGRRRMDPAAVLGVLCGLAYLECPLPVEWMARLVRAVAPQLQCLTPAERTRAYMAVASLDAALAERVGFEFSELLAAGRVGRGRGGAGAVSEWERGEEGTAQQRTLFTRSRGGCETGWEVCGGTLGALGRALMCNHGPTVTSGAE